MGDDEYGAGGNQGWNGPPPNNQYGQNMQQAPPQQAPYDQQSSGMSKQSIAEWNNQEVQKRDFIGYNPNNYGNNNRQQQQPPPQQQQQQAPKKAKKKKKFKLFGK